MATTNRFQVLADTAEDEIHSSWKGQDLHKEISQDRDAAFHPQDGWGEDLHDIPEEDLLTSESNAVIQDEARRRKISVGPRDASTAGSPVIPGSVPLGRGRGGGLHPGTTIHRSTMDRLTPITETLEVDNDAESDNEGDITNPNRIMKDSIPPATDLPEKETTTFTFRAQLTWGLEVGTRVNLPQLFREWVKQTGSLLPDFALLPFDDDKGTVVTTPEQVPYDNPTFFQDYYYNHRILNHGNMTGMVQFRCSVSWNKVKRMRDPYFQWLHLNKIYLNLAKFKSATLIVCGFLVGAHPGHLRREDAEKELQQRLGLTEEFPFQLSSRTISVPKTANKSAEKYSFPAVAIETSARYAKQLREAFFTQPKPSEAAVKYPYTGPYQFVPMLQSKEWPVLKIYQLAKVHVKLCDNLKVIYVQNLKDIRNAIGPNGHTLMKGFLGMTITMEGCTLPLLHSIHNTGRENVKAILVHQEYYDYAIENLSTLHVELSSGVPQEYHENVFVENLEAGLTSSHRDTIQSCNSSHYANDLLTRYNPQDAEEANPPFSQSKRFRPNVISYAAATVGSSDSSHTLTETTPVVNAPLNFTTPQPVTPLSSLTDQDLDVLYERLKHHVELDGDSPGITTDEMEKLVSESNQAIQDIREEMRNSVADLAKEMANISTSVKKQNAVVVGIQKSFEATSKDIKDSVNNQVAELSNQIENLRTLVTSLMPPSALQAETRSVGHRTI